MNSSERFNSIADLIGDDYALFCFCAVDNIAYDPKIVFDSYEEYKEIQSGKTFEDGETNIHKVLNNGLTDAERWVSVWGIGDENRPYTDDDYKALDTQFEVYASRLIANGGMDEIQEDTLRYCSKMRLEAGKALAKGGRENVQIAATLNKTIQDTLAAEQLRKKDVKPVDIARVDGIVEALKNKYGYDVELTMDEAMELFRKWQMSQHYPATADAVEEAIHMIINAGRDNDDLPDIAEIPKKNRFSKEAASQFADDFTSEQEKAYEYLGLKR